MALKHELLKSSTPPPKSYPYIGEGDMTGKIVLFVQEDHGVVLAQGRCTTENKRIPVGLVGYFKESHFIPFNGKIVLSN